MTPTTPKAWLLPLFAPLARTALGIFYRLRVGGSRVPPEGPALLVANHPNSLIDPAAVAAIAGRPIRFLAKAPLFTSPTVGWLVKGAGAIPVYRQQDDPQQMNRNEDAFRATWDALAGGAAVGIFPEGWSHYEPALTPLKTGAARIALGAAMQLGRPFPIVPVGLVFGAREMFRSRLLALVGEPVPWDDLASRDATDADAVRALTTRIDEALRGVTFNLERWEDAPLIEAAEAVYAAEFGAERDPRARVSRLGAASETLRRLRREEPEDVAALARELARHARVLRMLGLSPATLSRPPGWLYAARWALARLAFFAVATPVALVGAVLFYLPYRLVGWIESRAHPEPNVRATYKLLGGIGVLVVWILGLALGAAVLAGWLVGLAVLVALPGVALTTLFVREQWGDTVANARRYFLLRGREDVRRRLKRRQHDLAERLEELRAEGAGRDAVSRPEGPARRTIAP